MDGKRRGKRLMGEKEGMEVESYRELRGRMMVLITSAQQR
jgi:hypothetical protein